MDSVKNADEPGCTAATRNKPGIGSVIAGLITAMSLLVPMGYLCGQKFRVGLFGKLGLDESLVPLDSNGYVRVGFESGYGILLLIIERIREDDVWQLIAILAVVVVATIVGLFIYRKLPKRAHGMILKVIDLPRRFVKNASGDFVMSMALVTTSIFLILVPIFGFLFAFSLIVPAIGAEAAGRAEAERMWLQALGQGEKQRDFASFKFTDDGTHDVKLIECGDHWCIAFDRDHFIALDRADVGPISGTKAKFNTKP